MKYFLIETDERYNYPRIRNWHEKIDIRDICRDKAYKLPKRELVFIKSNPETLFTDVIAKPFFLVSEKVKKIILLYQPNTILKELVILDKIYEKAERYYLPVFDEIECLAEGSVLNPDNSVLREIVLDRDKIKDMYIFRIAGVKKQYIVGNLDIVESMLKRGCEGIKLTELDLNK